MLVARTVGELYQTVDQRNLRVGLCQFLFVSRGVFRCGCSIQLELHQTVAFLVAFQFAVGRAQFGIDFCQTVVDESLGAHGNLVFIFIGLTVVTFYQLSKIIHASSDILVLQLQIKYRSLF